MSRSRRYTSSYFILHRVLCVPRFPHLRNNHPAFIDQLLTDTTIRQGSPLAISSPPRRLSLFACRRCVGCSTPRPIPSSVEKAETRHRLEKTRGRFPFGPVNPIQIGHSQEAGAWPPIPPISLLSADFVVIVLRLVLARQRSERSEEAASKDTPTLPSLPHHLDPTVFSHSLTFASSSKPLLLVRLYHHPYPLRFRPEYHFATFATDFTPSHRCLLVKKQGVQLPAEASSAQRALRLQVHSSLAGPAHNRPLVVLAVVCFTAASTHISDN